MKRAKATMYLDANGEVAFVRIHCGNKTKTLHRREYENSQQLADHLVNWAKRQRASEVVCKEKVMTPEQQVEQCVQDGMTFGFIIDALAAAVEGLERWDDLPDYVVPDVAMMSSIHVSYIEGILGKLKAAFTPKMFCDLAHAEDSPEAFCSDPTFLTTVNAGLNRIKDAVYGNTRADRMVQIKLR